MFLKEDNSFKTIRKGGDIMKVKTAIYDTLFKTIILENDNLEYIRNIINWVTGLSLII